MHQAHPCLDLLEGDGIRPKPVVPTRARERQECRPEVTEFFGERRRLRLEFATGLSLYRCVVIGERSAPRSFCQTELETGVGDQRFDDA